jgi:hypothetical protein
MPDHSTIVTFPTVGEVLLQPLEEAGKIPEVRFTSKTEGKLLLDLAPINDASYRIDQREIGNPFQPIIRFQSFEKIGLPTPIVLVAAIFPGGSDYSVRVAAAGEINGRLIRMTGTLPELDADGGVAILDSTDKLGAGLVLWNMIWRENESHVGPHDHWFRFYKLDLKTGHFILAKSWTVNKKQQQFRFRNLLLDLTDFRG